jgi:sortase B
MKKLVIEALCFLLASVSLVFILPIPIFYDDSQYAEGVAALVQPVSAAVPVNVPAFQDPIIHNIPAQRVKREKFLEEIAKTNNNDIIGHLKIGGTSVDYFVVQSTDNRFYLEHDIHKNKSSAGWIFLDYENDILKPDKNTIIYGHNMRDDVMFHALRNYQDESFFRENKYITFDTLYEDQVWEVFSFYRSHINFNYIQVIFSTDDEFFNLALQMQANSIHKTDITLTKTDRILTLSTCTNESPDTRFVLNARLLSP